MLELSLEGGVVCYAHVDSEVRLRGRAHAEGQVLLLHLLLPELQVHGRNNIRCLCKQHYAAGVHVKPVQWMGRPTCTVSFSRHYKILQVALQAVTNQTKMYFLYKQV